MKYSTETSDLGPNIAESGKLGFEMRSVDNDGSVDLTL
jgi:hypothetical protein